MTVRYEQYVARENRDFGVSRYECMISPGNQISNPPCAPGRGFEPLYRVPKTLVLPLDDPGLPLPLYRERGLSVVPESPPTPLGLGVQLGQPVPSQVDQVRRDLLQLGLAGV